MIRVALCCLDHSSIHFGRSRVPSNWPRWKRSDVLPRIATRNSFLVGSSRTPSSFRRFHSITASLSLHPNVDGNGAMLPKRWLTTNTTTMQTLPSDAPHGPSSNEDESQLAHRLWEENQEMEAIQMMEKAVLADPRDRTLREKLADMLLSTGDFSLALQRYSEALAMRGDTNEASTTPDGVPLDEEYTNASLLVKCGECKERLGDHLGARESYDEALRTYPKHGGAHIRLGHCLLQSGKAMEALGVFRDGGRLATDNPDEMKELLYGESLASYHLHAYDDALELAEGVIKLDEKFAPIYMIQGDVQRKKGNAELAIIAYSLFFDTHVEYYERRPADVSSQILLDDTICEMLLKRGRCYLDINDPDVAKLDFISVGSTDASQKHKAIAKHYLGKCAAKKGNWWKVVDMQSQAIELDAELISAYHDRSMAYEILGKHHEASRDESRATFLYAERIAKSIA